MGRQPTHVLTEGFFDALDQVFAAHGEVEPVSVEAAQEMCGRVAAKPDLAPPLEVSVKLFETHQKLAKDLARSVVKHKHGKILDQDDAEQIALAALAKASRRFQVDGGVKFKSFAWTCIENALKSALRPEIRAKLREPNSLDDPIAEDDPLETFSSGVTYEDVGRSSLSESGFSSLASEEMRELAQKALESLDPRERLIINGWMAGQTLETIGGSLEPPIGGARVCQIIKAALPKMREVIAEEIGEGESLGF